VKISEIKIGQRSRADLGDISSLAASIESVGLLHPIVVTKDGTLIAGARRIAAFTALGKKEIPVVVVNSISGALKLLIAERDENTERKDFSPSEAVAMAERLEPFEREAASKRKEDGRGRGAAVRDGNDLGENSTPRSKALDRVASAVGMSRPTLMKAKAVVEAAKQNPKKYGAIAKEMDATGNVHGAFKQLGSSVVKSAIRKMAAESNAEMREVTAWMSEEERAALSPEMMRQRGELTRLVEDIATRLLPPEEFARLHRGHIPKETINNASGAHRWLGEFLTIWKSNGK